MKGRFLSVLSVLLVISGTFLTRQSCKPFVTRLHLELMAVIVFNSFNFQCLFTESIHATNLCPQDLEFLHINLEFIKEYTEASTESLRVCSPPLVALIQFLNAVAL